MSVNNNLIRVGRVSSVDPATCSVRVTFDDKDDLVSYDLPVILPQTMKNKDYLLPDVGEQVVCLFLANGLAQGFCVGSFYSEEDGPPTSDPNKRMTKYSDGTTVEYDTSTNTMTIDCKGSVIIKAAGAVSMSAASVNVNAAGGNVSVTGDVSADGVSLKNHVHGGVVPGGGNTGAPR